MRKISLLLAGFMMLAPLPVLAEEGNAGQAVVQESEMRTNNPYLQDLTTETKRLAEKMSEEELTALVRIRQNFGVVNSVRIVEDEVGNAVKACGEANKDMKEQMTARHKNWLAAVEGALTKAEADIEVAINGFGFQDPAEVRAYLKLIKDAADHKNEMLEKTPVTSKDACEGLLASMDRTQDKLVDIISQLEPAAVSVAPVKKDG